MEKAGTLCQRAWVTQRLLLAAGGGRHSLGRRQGVLLPPLAVPVPRARRWVPHSGFSRCLCRPGSCRAMLPAAAGTAVLAVAVAGVALAAPPLLPPSTVRAAACWAPALSSLHFWLGCYAGEGRGARRAARAASAGAAAGTLGRDPPLGFLLVAEPDLQRSTTTNYLRPGGDC